MTKKEELCLTVAILTIVGEHPAHGIPSGHLYAAVMDKYNLEAYTSVVRLLTRAGMIMDEHHLLRPTPAGVELAKRIEAELAAAKQPVEENSTPAGTPRSILVSGRGNDDVDP